MQLSIGNLYVKTVAVAGLAAGTMYAVTKGADMLSSNSTQDAMLGGLIFISSVFLGGWSMAKIILVKEAKEETKDESAGGSSAGNSSDHSTG